MLWSSECTGQSGAAVDLPEQSRQLSALAKQSWAIVTTDGTQDVLQRTTEGRIEAGMTKRKIVATQVFSVACHKAIRKRGKPGS